METELVIAYVLIALLGFGGIFLLDQIVRQRRELRDDVRRYRGSQSKPDER